MAITLQPSLFLPRRVTFDQAALALAEWMGVKPANIFNSSLPINSDYDRLLIEGYAELYPMKAGSFAIHASLFCSESLFSQENLLNLAASLQTYCCVDWSSSLAEPCFYAYGAGHRVLLDDVNEHWDNEDDDIILVSSAFERLVASNLAS